MDWNVRLRARHFLLSTAIVLLTASTSTSLKCYKCTILPPAQYTNETARLCSHFDGSALYQVDCPYSTFCMKKTFELNLPKGKSVHGTLRDCAAQKYNYQTYDGHQWRMKETVEDSAYQLGCYPTESQGVKSSSAEYCYCNTNLCNNAKSTHDGQAMHHTDAMAVIFVFNAMKYIRSLQ